ncbi:MAG: DNA polymerase ligase N-terminal domain-containing protein [Coriobacteriia bacterium]|nr:DNA polymerase ligase N-terminal domain-containing protein [Coriobacteriia bacterium]
MAPLDEYQRKRDFSLTSEPAGKVDIGEHGADRGNLSFVIHKHAARSLHYDLRLELDGVLLSWAVPKGPSLDPADKRLAVHVEDHPIEYGAFEGTIPPGEYGAGTVIIWDRGTWRPFSDPREGLVAGALKFELDGEKLQGGYALIRLKPRPGEKRDNWLLIKERDEHARPHSEYDVLEERPQSVASGRDIEQVAAER